MIAPSPTIAGQADGSSVGLDFRSPDRPARGRGASRHSSNSVPVAAGGVDGVRRTGEPIWVALIRQGGRPSQTPADLRLRLRRPRALGMSTEGALFARSRWEPGTQFLRGRAEVARVAHNHEAVGSNPTRATTPPAGCAPASLATVGGRRVRVGRRHPSFITHRNELAGNSARDVSKALRAPASLHVLIGFVRLFHAGTLAWKGTKCRHRFATEKFAENVS